MLRGRLQVDRRRLTVTILSLAVLMTSPGARSQDSARPRRIGVLAFSTPSSGRAYFASFRDELARLGWIEGRNLQSTYRYADGDVARLPALAAELVALEPDVLFSSNVPGSMALARATLRIPIVMTGPNDPVATGLVKDLARPGGNVTGIASGTGNDIIGKRFEILKGWLPRFSRLAVFYDPRDDSDSRGIAVFQEYANGFGLRIDPVGVSNLSEIRVAIEALSKDPPDAIYFFTDAAIYANRDMICTEALRMRVPTMSGYFPQFAESGCLSSYAASVEYQLQESARYVDQILRGANPAAIPVSQPTRLEFVINARTAASLGLTIPPKLRLVADRVIE
jgi:putative ABC transport system substrate-binding protein